MELTPSLATMGKSRAKGKPGRSKKRKRTFYGVSQAPKAPSGKISPAEQIPDLPLSDDDLEVSAEATSSSSDSDGSGGEVDSSSSDSDLDEECEEGAHGFRLIDLECLQQLLSAAVCCSGCNGAVTISESQRGGLASCLELSCVNCGDIASEFMSKKFNRVWEVNRRAVFGMRLIGRGRQSMVKLAGALNVPSPMSRSTFYSHAKGLHSASKSVAERSMTEAAEKAVSAADGGSDIAASYDGTWMRRGFASLFGAFTIIAYDVGKVVDCEVLSKFCHKCTHLASRKEKGELTKDDYDRQIAEHDCSVNTTVSAPAMESAAAKTLWARSFESRKLRYTTYIGDGDTKSFKAVRDACPYGPEVPVVKEECVGHVQKRIGTSLRKLKKNLAGKKLADGRTLGGRGRLTDAMIDKLQAYYGMAVRNNSGDLQAMARAIWASLMHRASSDSKPQHQYCPPGINSWCRWQQQQAGGDVYAHHNILPEAVWKELKPVYIRLSDRSLLERCQKGATQNRNEAFNGLVWQLCPKTGFASAPTVQMCVYLAVAWFNDGGVAVKRVLDEMGLPTGYHTTRLIKLLDRERQAHAARKKSEEGKRSRKKRRRIRKGIQDEQQEEEGLTYEAGGFD